MPKDNKKTPNTKTEWQKGKEKFKNKFYPSMKEKLEDKGRKIKAMFSKSASEDNAASWYAQDKQLLSDVASLPYSQMLGNKIGFSRLVDNQYVPGIMALRLAQTLGFGKLATDAATVAARSIYSWVRHANSGSANYEAPDLLMYIVAHHSAGSWIEALRRLYGVMMLYSARNRYYVETLVQALGFNYQDISEHLNDLRAYINQNIARLNTLYVPTGMPIKARWDWCNSGLYVDDEGAKAQTYVYVTDSYLQIDGYGSETGTQLIPVDLSVEYGPGMKFSTIKTITERFLSPLLSNEDFGIMSGDIRKAYSGNVEVKPLVPENYIVVPSASHEVLSQIHNATAFDGADTSNLIGHTIVQDANGVIVETGYAKDLTSAGSVLSSTILDSSEHILDMYKDDVQPEDTIVATRLVTIGGKRTTFDGVRVVEFTSSGSEVVKSFTMYKMPYAPGQANPFANVNNYSSIIGVGATGRIAPFTLFDWHPRLYVQDTSDPEVTGYEGIIGDLENYTVITADVLERMHKIALLSELAITAETTVK